jgi:hypothetical protein
MSRPVTRGFGVSLCLLTLLGFGSQGNRAVPGGPDPGPAHDAAFIASFVAGCEQAPPRIRTTLLPGDHPRARPRDAAVASFLAGSAVPGTPRVIAHVELRARSRNTSLGNLMDYARREARRVGGELLVDVRPGEAAPDPRGPGHSPLMLTADIATWNGEISAPAAAPGARGSRSSAR